MKLCIAGANGFLGQYITKELDKEGIKYTGLYGKKDCDFLDYGKTFLRFFDEEFDTVVLLSSLVGGIEYNMNNPATLMLDNLKMGLNVIQIAQRTGVSRIILAGTICSYPEVPEHIPFKEEDVWKGLPDYSNRGYGVSKLTLMELLDNMNRQYKLEYNVALLGNLYGPLDNFEDSSSHVVPALIKKFVKAKQDGAPSVQCYGTGNATRDLNYVEDSAQAMVALIKSDTKVRSFNIGSGVETSIKTLAEDIKEIVGYSGTIEWLTNKSDGQPRRVLDSSRISRELGWQAVTPLRVGLQNTVDWYLGQKRLS